MPLVAIQTEIGPNLGLTVVDNAWCSRIWSDTGGRIAGERRRQTGYFLDLSRIGIRVCY
jgi:hypothetical protein